MTTLGSQKEENLQAFLEEIRTLFFELNNEIDTNGMKMKLKLTFFPFEPIYGGKCYETLLECKTIVLQIG